MPIYEYVCPECGNKEERIVPFSDRNIQVCLTCSRILDRLVSLPGNAKWLTTCETASKGKPCK